MTNIDHAKLLTISVAAALAILLAGGATGLFDNGNVLQTSNGEPIARLAPAQPFDAGHLLAR